MTVRRALGLLAVAIAGAAVLNAAGTALPAPPLAEPDRLVGWWARQGTAAATLSVARLGAMALCCYLIVISLLGTVAGLTRWRWSETLAIWIATPALRRMIAGGSLVAAMTSTQAAAAAPALYSVVDLGEAQAESLHHSATGIAAAQPQRAGHSITDLGATAARVNHHSVTDIGVAPVHRDGLSVTDLGVARSEPVDSPAAHVSDHATKATDPDTAGRADSKTHPTTSNPASTNNNRHPTTSNPASTNDSPRSDGFDTWLVEPGDHLWGIAAATVAERSGSDDPAVVARYWLKLIEANTDTVGDRPDLIHPGQVIRLPG